MSLALNKWAQINKPALLGLYLSVIDRNLGFVVSSLLPVIRLMTETHLILCWVEGEGWDGEVCI